MNDSIPATPTRYESLRKKSNEIGFTMPSDLFIGTLLQSLVASKLQANILELGTGMGLSLAWMVEGLNPDSQIISIDNDENLISVVRDYFMEDERIKLICTDGASWIKSYEGEQFDLIFADAWPGKYSEIVEVLDLVKEGGFYVIDDMSVQPNWPEGHEENVVKLIKYLEGRKDFTLTKMDWSTGVIVMTKKV